MPKQMPKDISEQTGSAKMSHRFSGAEELACRPDRDQRYTIDRSRDEDSVATASSNNSMIERMAAETLENASLS